MKIYQCRQNVWKSSLTSACIIFSFLKDKDSQGPYCLPSKLKVSKMFKIFYTERAYLENLTDNFQLCHVKLLQQCSLTNAFNNKAYIFFLMSTLRILPSKVSNYPIIQKKNTGQRRAKELIRRAALRIIRRWYYFNW